MRQILSWLLQGSRLLTSGLGLKRLVWRWVRQIHDVEVPYSFNMNLLNAGSSAAFKAEYVMWGGEV
jgi:hypothetical protein